MTSKIINMVERMKDDEDLALEALFASEPIADDGFSNRVLKRLRRRLWVRRLALPIAAAAGLSIALPPSLEAARTLGGLLPRLPLERIAGGRFADLAAGTVPDASMIAVVAVAVLAILCLLPVLED